MLGFHPKHYQIIWLYFTMTMYMTMNMCIIMIMNIYISKANEEWLRLQPSMSGTINELITKERSLTHIGTLPDSIKGPGFYTPISIPPPDKPMKTLNQILAEKDGDTYYEPIE